MEMYLLKSAACLVILFVFYKTVLENTSLHTTKRFYLLGSLVISFVIPFITFTEYVIATPSLSAETFTEVTLITEAAAPDVAPVNYISYLLAGIYGLGVLIFSIRFGRNMFRLFNKVSRNTKLKNHSIFHVLLKLPITPHSFFNYIFFSKNAYDAGEIPEEVIVHETAHVEQKHSWDIVFIEILRIVFWFNPFLYLIKHSIKLNHEFLADRTVLNRGADTSRYQTILLNFSSPDSYRDPSLITLAHSINYSSSGLNKLFSKNSFGLVKKRFTVMKTHTSKRAAWFRILIILPVLAVLIYGFSSTKTIEKTDDTNELVSNDPIPTARSIEIQIEADGTYLVEGFRATKNTLAETVGRLHQDLTPAIRNHMMNIHITRPKEPSREEVQFVYDALLGYGFYRLVAGNQEVVRGKGNTPMASESTAFIKNKPVIIMVQVSEITINGKPSSLKTFAKDIDKLTKNWEETDYTESYPSIRIASTPDSFLKKLDKEFKKTHFSKANGGMSLIPPKPPLPNASGDMPPPPPPAPKVYKGVNDTDGNMPPPPPPPPSALDHVIEMAKKGATFYFEKEKISSDKAIQYIKANENLNIETKMSSGSKRPVVKISKKGYTHKKKGPKNIALESGTEVINGQETFYTKINNETTYFYNTGAIKNKEGQSLSKKEAPSFYLDGSKISPNKASSLLKRNTKYVVSVTEQENNTHKIMLNNVYKVSNPNSVSQNFNNPNSGNYNNNKNPNSVIDLTQVISEGATFYLNDKKISTEKAKYLAEQTDNVARVNVKKSKTENPKVYFWTK